MATRPAEEAPRVPVKSGGWRGTLDAAATIIMIAAGLVVLVLAIRGAFAPAPVAANGSVAPPTVPVPAAPVALDGAARRGSPTARVALVEYSDFECPYCARFVHEILPALLTKYVDTGRVLMVFRHDPLAKHPFARRAAEAAVCAGEQGKFWEAHDLFFGDQDRLGDAATALPATLHLAAAPFASCLGGRASARVDADLATGRALGVPATPTFFIGTLQLNGQVHVQFTIAGARPLGDFEKALDDALALPNSRTQR